jgi:hypothetical protein
MWLILVVLTLTLPTLAHADEYDTEMRLLDLELSNIYLRQHAIVAELSRERTPLDVQGSLIPRQRTSIQAPVEDVYILPSPAPSPSMRPPPWLQPVDPMIPMLPEDRARMHCLGPRDCYLNQTGRERF